MDDPSGFSLCVVAPCYNEVSVIERFLSTLRAKLDRIPDGCYRIVIVDDGSTDGTLEILNQLAATDARLEVYSLSRNFGHQIALSAGLDVAHGDAILLMDSDLQHPPEVACEMVRLWRSSGADVISAVRRTTSDASLFKRWSGRMFYALINAMSETPIMAGAADFCLLSARAHRALCAMPERHRFLRGMISWIGFERAVVEYDAPARQGGESKYTPLKMAGLAMDAIVSFSATPMKMATRLGAAAAVAGGAYLLFALWRYLAVGDLERGWGSLIGAVLILGGIQLLFLGLMGEYLVRLFDEAKRRPLYLFKQTPATKAAEVQR
jgi:dolichol-phosphate mannosyltransferase